MAISSSCFATWMEVTLMERASWITLEASVLPREGLGWSIALRVDLCLCSCLYSPMSVSRYCI